MGDFIQRVRGCAWWGMQPSELLRCELGEATTAGVSRGHLQAGEQQSTGESRGHLAAEYRGHLAANKKKDSEMGGTRCQEEDPGRGR